jgi:hypothetical protein
MKANWAAAAGVLSLGLAGCYTADAPLLTEANSVAPFAKISFREQGAKDLSVLTREGSAYTIPSEDGTGKLTLRFMATNRPNWYVAQASAPPSGTPLDLLYAVVRVDLAKREAYSYRALATDPKETGPGLRLCNDLICIDDVNAYVASALAFADRGGAPDATYEIMVE